MRKEGESDGAIKREGRETFLKTDPFYGLLVYTNTHTHTLLVPVLYVSRCGPSVSVVC